MQWEPASDPGSPVGDSPGHRDSLGMGGPSTPSNLDFHLDEPDDEGDDREPRAYPQTRPTEPSESSPPVALFPQPGETLGGFRVVSELGRGAFARVYLAEQVELAGRPVALKVAKALGDEPQALARLQHTHIVPIHSIHDDPATGLRLLCMPFVGGANLAQILERSGARLPTQASGRSLLEALDGLDRPHLLRTMASRSGSQRATWNTLPEPAPNREPASPTAVRSVLGRYLAKLPWRKSLDYAGDSDLELAESGPEPGQEDLRQPARRFLRSHTYVQAAVWIAARLAEGLDHAHARGVLHRDLKPSNILIAADGTPMLLDFNLSADTNTHAGAEADRAHLGGTLPYMAPEHLDAFNPGGKTPVSAVDERSDLYAIGLILYEMVAGRHPFEEPPANRPMVDILRIMTEERLLGPPLARSINPMVPRSLDAIIAKALDPMPARRYAHAADMAEDLQRFLDDRPNLHAPEPSLKERAGKWWRRHPEVRGAGPVAATAAILLFAILGAAWSIADYAEMAQSRLVRNHFNEDFRKVQLLLNTANGTAAHRKKGVEGAEKLLRDYQVLSDPNWMQGPLVRRLPPRQRDALREDLAELLLLTVRAKVTDTRPTQGDPEVRKALRSGIAWLDLAETFDPHPSSALFETRARYYRSLADAPRAEADDRRAQASPPRSARDYYLRGTERLAREDYDGAEADLTLAVALDPKRFWAWFTLGLCQFERGRYEESIGDFSVCTVLSPDFEWPYLNRGLALAASGKLLAARYSYDKALSLNADFIEARYNRALVCLLTADPAQALADLDKVIRLGRRDPNVRAARAEALARLGRRGQAENEFADALKIRPDDARILVARGMANLDADPSAARADFERILKRDESNGRAHYGMAMLLRRTELPEALKHARQARMLEPRADDALRLRCVLLGRLGQTEAEADANLLAQSPSPHNLYNAACALCLLDQARGTSTHLGQARAYLDRALAMGFPYKEARADPDLALLWRKAPVRNRPVASAAIDTGGEHP